MASIPSTPTKLPPIIVDALGDAALILDVGTGEGQVARELAAVGPTVVGIDPIWAWLPRLRSVAGE
ncbi:MAG: class I SAM-dependent methyltransferase [Acidimicrobiales bacterium]